MHTVLDWWEVVGPARIRAHMRETVRGAAVDCAEAWGVDAFPCGEGLMSGPMLLVPLPDSAHGGGGNGGVCDYADAEALQNRLFAEGVEVPVKAIEGRLYVRISAHCHNERADYHALRDAVLRW